MTIQSYRPTQCSIDDRLNMVWFDPNAELAMPHTCCCGCDTECPTHLMRSIHSDEVYHLYAEENSIYTPDGVNSRDAQFCPECLAWIESTYRLKDDDPDRSPNHRWWHK